MRRSFFQNLIRVNWMTIERLDKLILKVSNIFFFFFFNVFSFDGKPRLIPPPHFISKRNDSLRLREYQGYRRVLESNGTKDRINAPCKIERPSYECVIRVNFRGLQLVDTRIMKTLFTNSITSSFLNTFRDKNLTKSTRKFLKNSSPFLTFQNS